MTMVTSLFLSDFLYNCCLGGLVSSFTQLFPELVGDGLHHLGNTSGHFCDKPCLFQTESPLRRLGSPLRKICDFYMDLYNYYYVLCDLRAHHCKTNYSLFTFIILYEPFF